MSKFPEIDLFFHENKVIERELNSVSETFAFGKEFGKKLTQKQILAFSGELGSGKTTLIKAIVEGYTGLKKKEVNSPTFVTLNIYSNEKAPDHVIYHFDLYRLKNYEDFIMQGFEEYFALPGVCCVEWSERIAPLLPKKCLKIQLEHIFAANNKRKIKISS